MGQDVVSPYLQKYPDKGLFVLGRTSNKSAPDFQDLALNDGRKMWEEVVRKAAQDWNEG